MGNQINFTGKKPAPFSNQITEVSYLANLQTDGYAYFNDDFQYRCKPDGTNLQLFYYDKQIWVQTNNIQDLQPNIFDLYNLIFGGGTNANNASVENAVQWLINTSKRDTYYDTTANSARVLNSNCYNCSTAVITAFWQAGFPINHATWTGNMRADFEPAGFRWIAGSRWESNQLIRGDILLSIEHHTQVYIGNNQDVNFGGNTGAVITHCPLCPTESGGWRNWDGILRYAGV